MSHAATVYRPRVDIVEKENELLLIADMPGTTRDAIELNYEDGQLTIHARVAQRAPEKARALRSEYGVGDYRRTFQIGKGVDAQAMHAEYHAGVLTVHLPKAEAAKPRKIVVNGV